MQAPFRYSAAGRDVLNGLSQENAVTRNVAQRQATDELGMQQQKFAQQYALQGLQNQMASRQQANDLTNTRLQSLYGSVGSLLRGLYSE
jgi:hypothetical protein